MCGVQALEGVATDSEEGESVSVTAQELQPAEGPDIQLLEPRVPQVQLQDVHQLLRVSHCHPLKPVKPVRENMDIRKQMSWRLHLCLRV